ncbi:hypothetical protein C9374_011381 [Naegleria lovaniensis]|uniref:Uncharacterized protein n=1 Tax=Naegleria lovaniensis TaxID=51637 RepID=A0AA88H268_NAELO|nr:uncharacterized protein C9374_011381 [Naegleria lovaniensis]KAG2392656.1 hypothetical protein C9374_011381 [Naegleria lovaniensis]
MNTTTSRRIISKLVALNHQASSVSLLLRRGMALQAGFKNYHPLRRSNDFKFNKLISFENNQHQMRMYSRKSHMKTALFLETYLHEAFIASIEDLITKLDTNNAHSLDWHEFHAQFEALRATLKAQSKLEDLGYVPAIHEFISENAGKDNVQLKNLLDLKTSHILEHQVINHIENDIKHHQHHQGVNHNKIMEMKKHLFELRNIVEEHFQKKEAIFNPVSEQYLSKEELKRIPELAFSKLLERDERAHELLHYYSVTKNSLDLTEAMIREILIARLNDSKAADVLIELKKHTPQEVWLQMTARIPELNDL